MCPLGTPNFELDSQRHALLLSLMGLVSLHREPTELLRTLAPQLQAIVPFDSATLALFDPVHRTMKMFLWEGASCEPVEIAPAAAAVGSVWRSQTVLVIDDLSTEKRFEPELRLLRDREMRSYCVLPLTTIHGKLGALGFASKRTHAFSSADVPILERAAAMVALCLDSTLTASTLAEEKARLQLLLEISAVPLQASDLEQSVASILESIQQWAVHDYVGVYLFDPASQALRLHTTDPQLTQKMAPQGVIPIEGSLAGQAFRSRRSLALDHAALSGLPFPSVKRGIELGIRSLYLCPLLSKKGPVGVLKVARREDQPFSARDVELLEQVAATLVPALEPEVHKEAHKAETHPGKGDARPLLDFAKELVASGAVARPGRVRGPAVTTRDEPPERGKPTWFGTAEALLESEQLLTAYFRTSRVGLRVLDTRFRYVALNDTLAEMNGIPAPAHLGKSIREMLGDFAELVELQCQRVIATGQPILNLEISFTLPTRTEPGHWIEHYIPIKDVAGQVIQVGIISVEVTEQKKLEESLRGVTDTLRQERKRQHVLLEVSRLLATTGNVGQVFPQISTYLRRILRQEYAALSLHDEKSGRLVRQAIDFPLRKSLRGAAETSTSKDPEAQAVKDRSSLIFTRSDLQGFSSGTADHLLTEGMQSLCCVPLMRPKGPLGVLVLGSTRIDAFKTDDLTLLNQVAAQLAIALENAATAHEVEQLRTRLGRERRYLEGEARTQSHFEGIIGESPALRKVLDQIAVVAESDATVLLLGETGTGKGLVARAIHHNSTRKGKAFVTLNCAAIPTGLLESELFGHEKGAFTGAVSQKVGRLETADKGTLFLDEIGEISSELQPKLLRVLQDNEFERLGGIRTIKVDVRLISATNRNLAKSMADKEFRSDLFYRLNVFPIRLPPLRERREDIPVLVRYFVRKYAARMGRVIETVPGETMDALINWHWPGNVRELENFIERSVILTEGTALRVPLDQLPAEGPGAGEQSLENAEREHIIHALREARGILSGPKGAAARLGVKRTTLQSKMERLGITRQDYTDSESEIA
jgi:formate hydrogenlyase transcriptional activator